MDNEGYVYPATTITDQNLETNEICCQLTGGFR
jgi:hypothetical protein